LLQHAVHVELPGLQRVGESGRVLDDSGGSTAKQHEQRVHAVVYKPGRVTLRRAVRRAARRLQLRGAERGTMHLDLHVRAIAKQLLRRRRLVHARSGRDLHRQLRLPERRRRLPDDLRIERRLLSVDVRLQYGGPFEEYVREALRLGSGQLGRRLHLELRENMREHEIVIRIKLPESLRKRWLVAGITALVGLSAGAYAASLPHTFSPNTPIRAQDITDNFNAVATVSANGLSYSLNATYCGSAPTTPLLPITGYSGMKSICQMQCSSNTAHMCTAEEVVRSASLKLIPPAGGWYSTGAWVYDDSAPTVAYGMTDCQGWTNNTNPASPPPYEGAAWVNGSPSGRPCTSSNVPILCCN
jgi:hypothetical protein